MKMDKKILNKVKKHLGIRKDNLILLKTYVKYRKEFVNMEEAVEYVLKKIEKEKIK